MTKSPPKPEKKEREPIPFEQVVKRLWATKPIQQKDVKKKSRNKAAPK